MLAARLSRTFIDTDHEVERVHGRSVEAIFRESGEGEESEMVSDPIGQTIALPVVSSWVLWQLS